jgi:hypothetical protein
MKFAFHKAKDTLFAKLCSWKMEGPYTHVEAMFGPDPVNPKLTICGSSKWSDGGVRLTSLDLSDTTNTWDIVEVPGIDEDKALQWFKDHAGEPYDTRGLIQFISWFPAGHNPKGWFCDEACLTSIGMDQAYRFDPNGMASILSFLKEYQSGTPNAPVVTITTGELSGVPVPVAPLKKIEGEIDAKLKEALPLAEDIAQAAEVAAPIISLIPGGAPVAAIIGVVAPIVDRVSAAAPTVGVAIKTTEAFVTNK